MGAGVVRIRSESILGSSMLGLNKLLMGEKKGQNSMKKTIETLQLVHTWAWRTASANIPVSCHAFSMSALSPKTAAENAASRPWPDVIRLFTKPYVIQKKGEKNIFYF